MTALRTVTALALMLKGFGSRFAMSSSPPFDIGGSCANRRMNKAGCQAVVAWLYVVTDWRGPV